MDVPGLGEPSQDRQQAGAVAVQDASAFLWGE